MKVLTQCACIGIAGFLGSIARYFVVILSGWLFRTDFPIGTMFVNLSGSLLLGFVFAFSRQRLQISDVTYLSIATGFIGAYTTFSTFMFESSKLFAKGDGEKAMFNIVSSIVMGLIAIRIGEMMGRTR